MVRLRKREAKLTSEVQQLTNNLNVLVSENGKLKAQVDTSRNSRVIYSNVYKTIEKEIRKHEYLYKLAIVDYLCYEEVEKRTADRIAKTAKRIEKDIGELEGSSKPLRRKDKEKRKSRLDTGLSHRVLLPSSRWRARTLAGPPRMKKQPASTLPSGKLHFPGGSQRPPSATLPSASPAIRSSPSRRLPPRGRSGRYAAADTS